MSGYSGTPLLKKLGIKPKFTVKVLSPPKNYFELFDDWPNDVILNNQLAEDLDFIHYFTKEADELRLQLPILKDQIKQNGMIWVSWPKKASKVPTDITEDVIRNLALEIDLVDVKVCAIDSIWSGLKLVISVHKRI